MKPDTLYLDTKKVVKNTVSEGSQLNIITTLGDIPRQLQKSLATVIKNNKLSEQQVVEEINAYTLKNGVNVSVAVQYIIRNPPVPEGLIKKFERIVTEYTDIPEIFVEIGGYHIISTTLGRFYTLKDMDEMKPNLFIMVGSPPFMTRRGVLVRYINLVRDTAIATFNYKAVKDEELKQEETYDDIKCHKFEGGSPEGLIDDINYFREKNKHSFGIISTEFGKTLNAIKKDSGYMRGMEELIVKLWSGESHYQSFSHRGGKVTIMKPRFLDENCYFNIFGTLQKPKHYLDDKMAETGMIRRFVIFTVDGSDLTKYKPPMGRKTDDIKEKLVELGKDIGREMYECYTQLSKKKRTLFITYDDKVEKKVNDYSKSKELMAREDDEDPFLLYQQNNFEKVLKLATNKALSEGRTVITENDITECIKLVEHSMVSVKETLYSTLIPEKDKEFQKNVAKVLRYIKQGRNRREIQQRVYQYGIDAKYLTKIIGYLIQNDKIVLNTEKNEGVYYNVL